jgi:hypothetical protein
LKSAMVTNPSNPRVGPDPSRVDVFQRRADGKLHPIPSWHTTGPMDFGTWLHEFDWGGVGSDLSHIVDDISKVEGGKGAGEAFLNALKPKARKAVLKGVFGPGERHHTYPEFMGGPKKQDMPDLAPPIHDLFHGKLMAALRDAGLLPVGGKTGSTKAWAELFKTDPAKEDLAHRVLRWVSQDFDLERGTSITPHLDRALGAAKPKVPPPPK